MWVGQEEIKIGQGIGRYLGRGQLLTTSRQAKSVLRLSLLVIISRPHYTLKISFLVLNFFFCQKMFFFLAVVLVLSHRVVVVWFNHGNSMITAAGFVFFNKFFVKRFINSGICRHVKNLDQDEVCTCHWD